MMVDLMEPKADEVVCDPACGTSGFLVAVSDYLKENRKEEVFFDRQNQNHYMNHMFHGFDMDRTMLRIGAMNMMTHGVDNPFIEYRDSLSDQNPDKEKCSLILANAREVFGLTARNRINKGFPRHTPLFLCPETRAVRHRKAA